MTERPTPEPASFPDSVITSNNLVITRASLAGAIVEASSALTAGRPLGNNIREIEARVEQLVREAEVLRYVRVLEVVELRRALSSWIAAIIEMARAESANLDEGLQDVYARMQEESSLDAESKRLIRAADDLERGVSMIAQRSELQCPNMLDVSRDEGRRGKTGGNPEGQLGRPRSVHRLAWRAYQLHVFCGYKQSRVAEELNKEYGTHIGQGQVSRMLKQFCQHAEELGLHELNCKKAKAAVSVDPRIIDAGERVEKQAKRQRNPHKCDAD